MDSEGFYLCHNYDLKQHFRIPGNNDKILLPSGSTAPPATVIGLQKPTVSGSPSTFAVSPRSHVTTIEINDKGANVYNGAKVRIYRFITRKPKN